MIDMDIHDKKKLKKLVEEINVFYEKLKECDHIHNRVLFLEIMENLREFIIHYDNHI